MLENTAAGNGALLLLIMVAVFVLGFLPGFIARQRRHKQLMPIAILNIGLFVAGWFVLMPIAIAVWLALVVWALTDNTYPKLPDPAAFR